MALSGRFVALLALGVAADHPDRQRCPGRPPRSSLVGWLLLVLAVAGVDLAAAASPRSVGVARELPARVRLGESVDEPSCSSTNRGSRRLRGVVRDAWQPSAGASVTRLARRHPGRGAAAGRRSRSPRSAAGNAASRPSRCAASARSDSPPARRASSAPGRIRVLPPFHSRKHLPSRLARLRELDGAHGASCCAARARSSTACASTCAATTCARSTGAPQHVRAFGRRRPAAHGAHLATRARPPRRDRRRLRRAPPPPASRTSRASTRRSRRRCCSAPSRRTPATASTSSPGTAGCAAGCRGRPAPSCSRAWSTRWPSSSRS